MGCGASTPTTPLQASSVEKIDLQSQPDPPGAPVCTENAHQGSADREQPISLENAAAGDSALKPLPPLRLLHEGTSCYPIENFAN